METSVHTGKASVMRMGQPNIKQAESDRHQHLKGLGVIFDCVLIFDIDIAEKVKKVNRIPVDCFSAHLQDPSGFFFLTLVNI